MKPRRSVCSTTPNLDLKIARRIAAGFGGKASAPEIKRNFRHNTKHKNAIDDALQDMVMSEMLEKVWVGTGGRNKQVYRLKE